VWEQPQPVRVCADSSAAVWSIPAADLESGPDRYLSVRSSGGVFPANRHFFAAIKDLQRDPVMPEVTVTPVDEHTLHVDLRAAAFAYFVHLIVPHEATHFSDNYFDLEPGESRTITVTNPQIALSADLLTVRAR